jgi:hypothetical protein
MASAGFEPANLGIRGHIYTITLQRNVYIYLTLLYHVSFVQKFYAVLLLFDSLKMVLFEAKHVEISIVI